MRELLFEIGTEEIPAGYLQPAYKQLKEAFIDKAAGCFLEHGAVRVIGTPRRLSLIVADLAERQKDIREELIGPSRQTAYDEDGKLTKAAIGFARSKGATAEELQVVTTPKGEYIMLVREVVGKPTVEILPEILQSLIQTLSFPKSMRWGDKRQSFARPIQWLLALFGDEIIHVEHEGIVSSNKSWGHRFMANDAVEIRSADSYEDQLMQRDVVVDPVKRRKMVLAEIKAAVAENGELAGGEVAVDEGLVDVVTNLVETPVGVCGTYDKKFLELVPEVLITSMREHQKYFPVVDKNGKLMAGFVAVNNTRVHTKKITQKGHQRVLRARLEDALFFYNSDKQTRLEDRISGLTGIIFQNRLGTMFEKKERIEKLVKVLAEKVESGLVEDCCRTAQLCKADLLSDMVGEFPSLQGIMGAAYAEGDGEYPAVVQGIREHYMPKNAGAPVPESAVGALVGLADRFDTLAGCFGIGQIPSGSADPFGLRRISLAILHIIEAYGYRFSLAEIVAKALSLYGNKVDGSTKIVEKILDFIRDRFVNDQVKKGEKSQVVEAAVAVGFDDIVDCRQRIAALAAIQQDEVFTMLAGSYKRIRNITKGNEKTAVEPSLLVENEERSLFALYQQIEEEIAYLVAQREYSSALKTILKLKEPVDNFFEAVMVMAEDSAIRQNRLNLLTAVGGLVLMIGDISKFQD